MSIKVALQHRTTYRFERAVSVSPHVVRLRPAPHTRIVIDSYSLRVSGGAHAVYWQQDPVGNHQARVVFSEPLRELEFVVELVADLSPVNPFAFLVDPSAERLPFDYGVDDANALYPYRQPIDSELLEDFLHEVPDALDPPEGGTPTVDFLVGLNRAVKRRVAYSVRMEAGVQTPDATLSSAVGSCRDSAWLLVAAVRRLGLAARFVSGYNVQLATEEETEDKTDLHAWTEIYLPGAGWVGFDPTSGLLAGEGHIPLAATPHYRSAAPVTGATEPTDVELEHSNSVRRLVEEVE